MACYLRLKVSGRAQDTEMLYHVLVGTARLRLAQASATVATLINLCSPLVRVPWELFHDLPHHSQSCLLAYAGQETSLLPHSHHINLTPTSNDELFWPCADVNDWLLNLHLMIDQSPLSISRCPPSIGHALALHRATPYSIPKKCGATGNILNVEQILGDD